MSFFHLISVLLSLLVPFSSAVAEEFALPPIIKQASPVDSLSEDPIVPAKKGKANVSTGSGSLTQSLEDETPYSVTDPGRPGELTQFRGLGDRAEDTNVQSLGIPLNYPQGGGFDFSSFPQYFWRDYQYSLSPSLGALDPRGSSGTLSLTPWTAAALSDPDVAPRYTALYAGEDLQEVSVGEKYQDRAAILAGYSAGLPIGPTGSISVRAYHDHQIDLRLHLLGTSIDSQLYDFGDGSSPHQMTDRVIPVAQLDWTPSSMPQVLVKTSVFYDNTYIHYNDPGSGYETQDRAQQLGIENADFIGPWRMGFGVRGVSYHTSDFAPTPETVANVMGARTFSWQTSADSRFLLDSQLQGVSLSGFGFNPQSSLGLREQWDENAFAVYFRGTYFRRFPSLADRFYSVPGYDSIPGILGNPALDPEDDLTYLLGFEAKSGIWSGSIQGYYQVRDNAEALISVQNGSDLQQQNVGQARIEALSASTEFRLSRKARFRESLNFTHSRIDVLSTPFPYISPLTNILGATFEPVAHFTLSADFRTQSSTYVSSTQGNLNPVAFVDVQAGYSWASGLTLVGRAENATGDNLVLDQGYPGKDRVLALSVIGPL